jgi:hypothetical protein
MVTYSLKILSEDDKYITAFKGSLEEIDKYTSHFENEKELLKKYNMRVKKSHLNNVIISYSYKLDDKVKQFHISDIVYTKNIDLFDRASFRMRLNVYGSPIKVTNLAFIKLVAERYASSELNPNRNLCKNILSKLNSDCSTEYYQLVEVIMKNYKMHREVYFIMDSFEKKLKKIEEQSYSQITINDYNNELINSGKVR